MELTTSNESTTNLSGLPPELLIRILSLSSINSILNISLCSNYLLEVANSEILWKDLVNDSIRDHILLPSSASTKIDRDSFIPACIKNSTSTWKEVAKFLLIHSSKLGWFIASTGRSRLLRLTISNGVDDSELTLSCSEYKAENAFTSLTGPLPPLTLPNRATFDQLNAAYFVPNTGPGSFGPDAGLFIQVLSIDLLSRPCFNITSFESAKLFLPTTTDNPIKLKLVNTIQEVNLKAQDEALESLETQRQRMVRMFTGVPPLPRIFPSNHFVECGTIRGVTDWINERGLIKNIIEFDEDGNKVLGRCEGFRVEIRRVLPPPILDSRIESVLAGLRSSGNNRRGVGMNGGPAILFDGQETDPAAVNITANIISQAFGGGGFTFQFPTQDGEILPVRPRRLTNESTDIIPTPLSRDCFYPIISPNKPFSSSEASSMASNGEILLNSLEGIWAGTYGPHGIEFSHISIEYFITTDENNHAVRGRSLNCIKVTGDDNVPAGQFTWKASLPPIPLSANPNLSTISTVTSSTLLRWSYYDPTSPSSSNNTDVPDWTQGVYTGKGRIAGSLFTNPQWTEAEFIFIRDSFKIIKEEGEEDDDERVIESVEELRVRWLGSVATFKRVRV